MFPTTTTLSLAIACLVAYFSYRFLSSRKTSEFPLPPGPRPLPILGNIRDVAPEGEPEWKHWLKHKDLYGPISSITLLGTTIIILNDVKLATELLEKRASVTSDRPRMVFAAEMCGWGNLMLFKDAGNELRETRKQFHAIIGTQNSLARFMSVQEVEAERLLLRILQAPEGFLQHVRKEAAAIILQIGYNYTVQPHKNDPLIDAADRALGDFAVASVPGAWAVDILPFLRYVPEWMPGTKFKRTAVKFKKNLMDLADRSMRMAKYQMAKHEQRPSFISAIFEKAGGKLTTEEEEQTKWSATALYAGGSDTSGSLTQCFFLAMVIYPNVQRKAQEEIDRVIGTGRLPNYEDRNMLPYVSAVVQEAFRWSVIVPMGFPHVALVDEVCGGYTIPKGALLMPNIGFFTRDPAVYKDPECFKPERFLGQDPEYDPQKFIFGYGKRICPGRLLANSSAWLTFAKLLAAFDIGKGIDAEGNEIEPEARFRAGTVRHPIPFEATIKPRSLRHRELVREVEDRHPFDSSDADVFEAMQVGG